MLGIRFSQLWNDCSESAMDEALHDMAVHSWFAGLDSDTPRLPIDSMIFRHRYFLEELCLTKIMLAEVFGIHQAKGFLLSSGTAVDASLLSTPSSVKNGGGLGNPKALGT